MIFLAKFIAEKLGPKATATDGSLEGTAENATKDNVVAPNEVNQVKDESCTDTITNIVGTLWNWSVIICMSVLPSQLPFDLLYLAMGISFGLALLVLAVEGYKYKHGLIKVFPKNIDVILPIINLALMVWLIIAPPPSDWKRLLWFSAIVHGSLFCLAVFGLATNVPFTLQYAMEKVPEEFWSKPSFLMINQHITMVWALMWGIMLTYDIVVSLTVPYAQLDSNGSDIYICNQVLPLVLLLGAFKFTTWYPPYMREKAAQLAGANVPLVDPRSDQNSDVL